MFNTLFELILNKDIEMILSFNYSQKKYSSFRALLKYIPQIT